MNRPDIHSGSVFTDSAKETAIASESSLKKDWLRPEEDEAWLNL
jgi:hypothetical protein